MTQLFGGTTDIFSLIFQLAFFALFFIMMFYGTKIQSWGWLRAIESATGKLQLMAHEGREKLITFIKERGKPEEDPRKKVGDFLEFFTVEPVEKDPAGVMQRLEHVLNIREKRFREHVKLMAPNASGVDRANMEGTLETAMILHLIYRVVRHYYILGKKTQSAIVIMQIQMQLGLIMKMAKSIMEALKAFSQGKPIGDSVGPYIAASFIRDYEKKGAQVKVVDEYTEDTTLYELDIEGRHSYIIRATGPGSQVGKPGEAIKKVLEERGERIKRLFMIDAGLKLEGEKTGDIIEGVGAVIGGPGVEKYKIETTGVKLQIPMDGFVIKESEEDAYGAMKKEIGDAVPKVKELLKAAILKRTEPGDEIIIAGIGNTIGIA
ncbi:MAG: DUF1512 domain-containing protein [Candidatus Lokiarchaeota archaeon]|nr:DUF1512 domain-containing protein [Candidatus Lokiarchaeota archaeon]